jgi:5-formyltetrahydrofolate cyclo-ligase
MSLLPPSSEIKTKLRQQALETRLRLPVADLSRDIREKLADWPLLLAAKRVLFYHPFRQEVDLMPLVGQFSDKSWFLPRTTNEGLVFLGYSPGQVMESGRYGILEPSESAALYENPDVGDMILLPGLGFDRDGYRLGYGKGYYDRFVATLRKRQASVLLVGISPSTLISTDPLPRDDWDLPVDWLACEHGLISVAP